MCDHRRPRNGQTGVSMSTATGAVSSPPTSVCRVTQEIRWGVVGPGRIAEKVVEDFAVVDGARAVAVASRSLDRAQDFAGRHGIERAHGSYAAILADPDVDVLYVATPHQQRLACADRCHRDRVVLRVR